MHKYSFLLFVLCCQLAGAQISTAKKILIVATSADNLLSKPSDHSWGAYGPEITEFYCMFYKEGFRAKDIDIVSPKGGAIPMAMPAKYPKKFKLSAEDKAAFEEKLKHTLRPSQINSSEYHVIYYSGGFSCLVDYPVSDSIAALAATIYGNGGIIGAVCDGIAGLIPIKANGAYLVSNKAITTNGYKHKLDTVSRQLVKEGAVIKGDKLVNENRIITARGVMPRTVAIEILKMIGYPNAKP